MTNYRFTSAALKGTAYGTGFFVRDDLVATNYHVVKDSYEIFARLVGRDANYACTVVGKDEENDLAILEVQGLRGYSLGLALTPVQLGQEIYVLSNPAEYEGTFSRGMVNAYRGRDRQIDAPLSHGSSGGPGLESAKRELASIRRLRSQALMEYGTRPNPGSRLYGSNNRDIGQVRKRLISLIGY